MEDAPDFSVFPAVAPEQWSAAVARALKGAPVESLTRRTADGLPVEPLYPRAADGAVVSRRGGPWQVVQRIDLSDPATANAEALHELENGADGLSLVFERGVGARGFGLPAKAEAITTALTGVHLNAGVSLDLDAGPDGDAVARAVATLIHERKIDPTSTRIRFGLDPLGVQARNGISWQKSQTSFVKTVRALRDAGFAGPLACTDGRIVHDAGGSEAQELAYVLSCALAYLRALEAGGLSLDDARRALMVRLSADTNQFLTMAKLRALRLLWAKVEQSCGLEPARLFVTAETAWRTMTRLDPGTNMLRATIAAFAAGVGGADAVTILPHTAALETPDRHARRVARNTQLLLLEESHLGRVDDPAAGSGGIEALTNELCRAAWRLFQEIEAEGGAAAALASGTLAKRIDATRDARLLAVKEDREPIVGTTRYRGDSETPVPASPDSAILGHAGRLAPQRLAEAFETAAGDPEQRR